MCNKHNHSQQPPMIFIEGNVGVGKSTFLKFLHEKLGMYVFYEPNEMWQDIDGNNMLEQFFLDQKRWAYSFQSYVLMTRVDQMLFADTQLCNKVCLVERSIYSGRYCFGQVARDIGNMNNLEWSLYKKIWNRESVRIQRAPGGFIYLRTPAEICYQRITNRGRFEEHPMTLSYLKKIEEKHENWFIKKTDVDPKLLEVPVLVLDFSYDLSKNNELQQNYIALVVEFINKIQNQTL